MSAAGRAPLTPAIQCAYRAIQHPTIAGAWTVQRPGCQPVDLLIIASKTNAEANAAARNQKEDR